MSLSTLPQKPSRNLSLWQSCIAWVTPTPVFLTNLLLNQCCIRRNSFGLNRQPSSNTSLSPTKRTAMELTSKKGASNWLTALLMYEFGFSLHNNAFVDALALCYSWTPKCVAVLCVYGSQFTVEHVLSCTRGGFTTLHHNGVTTNLPTEV